MVEIEVEGRKLNGVKGASSHYKLITHHIPTGKKLAKPYWYWAVSIEGSPYVSIKEIARCGKDIRKAHEEREGKE